MNKLILYAGLPLCFGVSAVNCMAAFAASDDRQQNPPPAMIEPVSIVIGTSTDSGAVSIAGFGDLPDPQRFSNMEMAIRYNPHVIID